MSREDLSPNNERQILLKFIFCIYNFSIYYLQFIFGILPFIFHLK